MRSEVQTKGNIVKFLISCIFSSVTEGKYKRVDLKRNELTRIDPYVFQFMLQGMAKGLTKRGSGSAALELFQSISTVKI